MNLPWSSDSAEHTYKSKVISGKQLEVLLLLVVVLLLLVVVLSLVATIG